MRITSASARQAGERRDVHGAACRNRLRIRTRPKLLFGACTRRRPRCPRQRSSLGVPHPVAQKRLAQISSSRLVVGRSFGADMVSLELARSTPRAPALGSPPENERSSYISMSVGTASPTRCRIAQETLASGASPADGSGPDAARVGRGHREDRVGSSTPGSIVSSSRARTFRAVETREPGVGAPLRRNVGGLDHGLQHRASARVHQTPRSPERVGDAWMLPGTGRARAPSSRAPQPGRIR